MPLSVFTMKGSSQELKITEKTKFTFLQPIYNNN